MHGESWKSRKEARSRQGTISVETALVIPLIFMAVFAGVEFVRLNVIRHSIRNATYEAARAAIVPGADAETAIALANEVLALSGIRDATVTISPNPILEETETVSVQVSVPIATNSWGVGMFFDESDLVSATELRTERAPMVQAQTIEELVFPPPPPPEDPPPPPPEDPPPPPPEDPPPPPPEDPPPPPPADPPPPPPVVL